MKSLAKWAVAALVVAVIATWGTAQPNTDRPPGVDAERWIPLTENSGLVLLEVGFLPANATVRPRGTEGEVLRQLQRGTALLMVNIEGAWTRIDLAPPPVRVQPLL